MLMDELVKESFDLDYDIIYKQADIPNLKEQINSIKTKQHEELFNALKVKIENLEGLLKTCDSQRKNFRIILVHLMKEKKFYDEFIGENDTAILFNKIKIHEELKNKIIDEYSRKVLNLQEKINKYEMLKDRDQTTTIETISIYTKPTPYYKNSTKVFTNNLGSNSKKKEIKAKILNTLSVSVDCNRENNVSIIKRTVSKDKKSKSPGNTNIKNTKSPLTKPFNMCKSQITIKKNEKNENKINMNMLSIDSKRPAEEKKIKKIMRKQSGNERDNTNKSTDFNLEDGSKTARYEIANGKSLNLSGISNHNKFKTKANNIVNLKESVIDSTRNKKVALVPNLNSKTINLPQKVSNQNQDKKKILESIEKDFYEHLYKGKASLTPILEKYDKNKKK